MKVPPTWKIVREIRRLVARCLDLPERVSGRRHQATWDRDRALVVTEGACPRLDDLAVLLLYPVEGVAASTLDTLAHFADHNVAVVVVSNHPLNRVDREALAAGAHLVIERPNRGYDFGGYRDGILELLAHGPVEGHLFVLNDSIWFPLSDRCTLIDDARADPADLFGIHYNARGGQPSRSHLQSYFYRFGPAVTRSPHLEAFWRDLVTYKSKDLTIRRCEMKLTSWFASRGFSVGQACSLDDFRLAIAALDGEDRAALVDYLAATGDKHSTRALQRLADGSYRADAAWRQDAMAGLLGRFVLASHPLVLLEMLRFPVLKKDRQPIYCIQRKAALGDRYSQHLSRTVRAEMRSRT